MCPANRQACRLQCNPACPKASVAFEQYQYTCNSCMHRRNGSGLLPVLQKILLTMSQPNVALCCSALIFNHLHKVGTFCGQWQCNHSHKQIRSNKAGKVRYWTQAKLSCNLCNTLDTIVAFPLCFDVFVQGMQPQKTCSQCKSPDQGSLLVGKGRGRGTAFTRSKVRSSPEI